MASKPKLVADQQFKIIKNAPLPPASNRGRGTIYPFADMEVGDAFDSPRDMGAYEGGNDKRQNVVGACARLWARRHNPDAKFSTRLLDANTVRCWRIA